MMTRTTSKRIALLKKLALLPIMGLAVFLFSTKTIAQEPAKIIPQQKKEVASTAEGASPELMKEYAAIVAKHAPRPNEKWGKTFGYYSDLTDAERARLEEIFIKMNKTKQAEQTIIFGPSIPPLPKTVPTKTQFESFKNAAVYGIWIDNKKVSNDVLNKYSNTDFKQTFVSPLLGGAKKGKSYTHQVDLMTTAYYDNYYKERIADKRLTMMIVRRPKNKDEVK